MSTHSFDSDHPDLGWTPAIPLPLYGGWLWNRWFGCHCGGRFKTELAYEEHYARKHGSEDD